MLSFSLCAFWTLPLHTESFWLWAFSQASETPFFPPSRPDRVTSELRLVRSLMIFLFYWMALDEDDDSSPQREGNLGVNLSPPVVGFLEAWPSGAHPPHSPSFFFSWASPPVNANFLTGSFPFFLSSWIAVPGLFDWVGLSLEGGRREKH